MMCFSHFIFHFILEELQYKFHSNIFAYINIIELLSFDVSVIIKVSTRKFINETIKVSFLLKVL